MRTRTRTETTSFPSELITSPSGRSLGTCGSQEDPMTRFQRHVASKHSGTKDVQLNIIETMVDNPLPNYAELRKKGKVLPTTRMTFTRDVYAEERIRVGYLYYRYKFEDCEDYPGRFKIPASWGYQYVDAPKGRLTAFSSVSESRINAAKVEAKSKLHSQGMDVLTFASEFHKTLAMLTSFRSNLEKSVVETVEILIRDLKRRKRRDPKYRLPKSFTQFYRLFESYWLEFRFGWRILWYDLKELDSWLSEKADKSRLIVGRFREEWTETSNKTGGATKDTRDMKIHVGYPGMLDPSKLGYANAVNTAWDILPFSLVVDWFFNVQETILAHTSAPANVRALPESSYLVTTCVCKREWSVDMVGAGGYDNVIYTNQPKVLYVEGLKKTREPIGDPRLTFPTFVGGPQGYQWLDFATLIRPMIRAMGLLR